MKHMKIICLMGGIIGILLCSVTIAQPISMPHVIFGSISDLDGNLLVNIAVKITNERTDETLTVQTNNNGQYQADLASMVNGYQIGDTIEVKAESGELSGISEVSVSTGPNDQCNLVLEEQADTPFPMVGTIILLMAGMALLVGFYRRK